MKRILIIISSLKLGGGAERVASTLGTELNKKYEVHYLTFYQHENNYEFKGKHYCLNENFKQDIISKGIKLISRAKKITSYCKKHKIDTCISFMEAANFPTILSKTLFGNRSKIIISERNNPLQQDKVSQKLIKILYNKADLIVSVSKETELILNKRFNVKKTKTIYNPIDIKKINRLSKEIITEKKIFNKNDFYFINIGRLSEQKNQIYLIKAFKNIASKNIRLIILGEGHLRKELEHLINKLNLQNNVLLLGNKKNIYPYLKKSNCFVMSSLYEGLPNTLIEAVSLNKYCISTDCKTGPREILFPELKVDEKIKYPYRNDNSVVIDVSKENIIKQLEKEMKIALKYKKMKNNNNIKIFEKNKIIKEWENVL